MLRDHLSMRYFLPSSITASFYKYIWAFISTLSFSHSSLLFYMNYKTQSLRTICVHIHQSLAFSNTDEIRPAYEMCSEMRRWVQASNHAVERESETSLGSVQEKEKWEQFWNRAVKRGSENSFRTVQWKVAAGTVLELCSKKWQWERVWNCAVKSRKWDSWGTMA